MDIGMVKILQDMQKDVSSTKETVNNLVNKVDVIGDNIIKIDSKHNSDYLKWAEAKEKKLDPMWDFYQKTLVFLRRAIIVIILVVSFFLFRDHKEVYQILKSIFL